MEYGENRWSMHGESQNSYGEYYFFGIGKITPRIGVIFRPKIIIVNSRYIFINIDHRRSDNQYPSTSSVHLELSK